jgi:hypothetical protein
MLVAEGKIGGRHYGRLGGRPRRPRVRELVAEEAVRQADHIVATFLDAISPDQRIDVRLKAAIEWLNIECQMRADASEMEFEQMSCQDLSRWLVTKLLALPAPGRDRGNPDSPLEAWKDGK